MENRPFLNDFPESKRTSMRAELLSWWAWGILKSRPLDYESTALPLSYRPVNEIGALGRSRACSLILAHACEFGAGYGSRTRFLSLEGWCLAVRPSPRLQYS